MAKLSWIKRNQKKFEGQERIPQREYKQRESHYFQGRRYLLNITETEESPKVILKSKKFIELFVRPETTVEKRHEIMTEWYRVQLKKQIPAIIEKWEAILKVKVSNWQVKQMKLNGVHATLKKREFG